MSLYLHLPAQTAADFEEALRRLMISTYIQQRFNWVDPIQEPGFFERFGGMFADALRATGATFDSSESWRWSPGSAEDNLTVVMPPDDAHLLLTALNAILEPSDPGAVTELFSASPKFQQAIELVADELRCLLELPRP